MARAKFRPTFARESKRRTRKPRAVSPVTERRRARKAAADKCRAEQRRLKTWIPDERKRVAGVIVQMRAHGRQQVAQLQAQINELIKLERDQLQKRIKKARADAKLGKCVDVAAGPQIFDYAYPKRPPHLQRGGQPALFSHLPAPLHGGGKIGDAYRVRGVQHATEKRALAAVLAHLVHDQGGSVVREQGNGASYVDGPMYGLEGEGKAAKLVELDPLDPRGHDVGRAGKHPAFKAGLRHLTTQPPPPRSSSKPLTKAERNDLAARERDYQVGRKARPIKATRVRKPKGKLRPRPKGASQRPKASRNVDGSSKSPLITPERLQAAFKRATKFQDRAYAASLISELGLPRDEGKRALLQLHKARRLITLGRLDLVSAVPADLHHLYRNSEITDRSARYHLVALRADSSRPQYAGDGPTTGTRPRMLPSSRPPTAAKAAAADRRSNTKTAKRKSTKPPSNPTHRVIGSPAANGAAKLLAMARPDGAKGIGNRFHVYFVADGDQNLVGRRKTRGGAETLAAHLAFKHRQPTIHGWYQQPKHGVRTSSFDLKAPHFRVEE